MMPLLPSKLMLLILSIASVLIALYGAYRYVEGKGYDKATQEQKDEQRKGLLAYAERITQAGEQHEKDQVTINRLASESSRMRIKFPVCKPSVEENPDRGFRILSDGVEQGFDELQAKAGELMLRCDQLNIDAIEANKINSK